METPAPLDLGGISGDLINFSSTIGALRAVTGTAEGNGSYVPLTQRCGKSPVTMRELLHLVELT
jgi:hypothetical protein